MNLKKLFFSFIISILFTNFANSKEYFTISVHSSAHPYGWHNSDKITGAIVELMRNIANDLNISIKTVVLPWGRSIADTKDGKIDAVLTAFYTKERAKYISFSIPYDTMDTSVFVAKGKEFPFNKWDDLIGLTGLTIVGDSQGDKWDKYEDEKLNVLRVVKIEQIFEMLVNGRADYAIFPRISTIREIEKMGYSDKITYLPTPIISQGIYIGISKKSPYHKYLQDINRKIKEYSSNEKFKKFIDKAFIESENIVK